MVDFYQTTPEARINLYKRNLIFFHSLRSSVRLRYAESIEYGEYEQKIRKLLNDHIKAEGVSVITPEVNIFDEPARGSRRSSYNPAARADAIAYRLTKTATEKMEKTQHRKFHR